MCSRALVPRRSIWRPCVRVMHGKTEALTCATISINYFNYQQGIFGKRIESAVSVLYINSEYSVYIFNTFNTKLVVFRYWKPEVFSKRQIPGSLKQLQNFHEISHLILLSIVISVKKCQRARLFKKLLSCETEIPFSFCSARDERQPLLATRQRALS